MGECYIYDAVRTPRGRGKAGGGLNTVSPIHLTKTVLQGLRDRNELDTSQIDDLILGIVEPVKEQVIHVTSGGDGPMVEIAQGGSQLTPEASASPDGE